MALPPDRENGPQIESPFQASPPKTTREREAESDQPLAAGEYAERMAPLQA